MQSISNSSVVQSGVCAGVFSSVPSRFIRSAWQWSIYH